MAEKAPVHARLMRLITVLSGHELEGLRAGDLAKTCHLPPYQITRDISALIDAGVVENVPGLSDRFRLGPKLIQIALAYQTGIARAQTRLQEVQNRYSRQ